MNVSHSMPEVGKIIDMIQKQEKTNEEINIKREEREDKNHLLRERKVIALEKIAEYYTAKLFSPEGPMLPLIKEDFERKSKKRKEK